MREFDPDYVIGHNTGSFPLIVCSKTGLLFSEQVNHHACEHPLVEGFVIPFDRDGKFYSVCDPEELCDYSESISYKRKIEIAIKIDKGLSSYKDHFINKIGFDFEKASELMEGWIPVVFFVNNSEEGDAPYKGYLCPGNCD